MIKGDKMTEEVKMCPRILVVSFTKICVDLSWVMKMRNVFSDDRLHQTAHIAGCEVLSHCHVAHTVNHSTCNLSSA